MTSVRGERTIYRETDVEREYDQPRSSYTTIKRYKVPESITRTVYDNDDTTTKDKVIIRRTERRDSSPSPARSTRTHKSHRHHHDHDDYQTEYKVTEKFTERERSRAPSSHSHRDDVDIRFTRTERERDPSPKRDIRYRVVHRDYSPERPRSEFRVVERDTELIRAPSPPPQERTETREWRFERERSFSPPRERERPYDIERYSKSTEYFQPQQPQPIIIRESAPQAPIIIREERREPQKIIIRREEPQYEFIEKKEIVEETKDETKSLVTREEPLPPAPLPVPETKPEEDYFYERRVIERRRRSDSYDRKTELRPKDSASQYSSDDSYEYIRREKVTDGKEEDRHHRRHLAEGAIAGIGAAEILRHHRKSQGELVGGRGRNALAGAALGAVGTEAISRVRSMRSLRRNSRSRSRSDDGEPRRRRHRKHRSRSRSKSLSRAQQLGGLAAVAGVAALAGYALKNRGNKETIIVNDRPRHRRSRSRRRRHSADTFISDEERQARNPEHRNRRIAQAGLASAAAAGIWEKVRSRSRGGRDRSKSRIRTGVPIAAAGLGGAALAGLYEKNKANKAAKKDAIIEDEIGRGRHRSRSRSRSRSAPAPYGDDRRTSVDGRPGLIAYGHDPIYPESRHGGHYSDEEPGRYRRRGGSGSSSPDNRRRSRSRRRNLAEAGAAAGVAAVAAHEIGKRRERSRASRSRERRRPEDDYYDDRRPEDPYAPPPVGNSYPPYHNNDPYAQQSYPGANYFPPPPGQENSGYGEQQPAYAHAQYNPADYAGQPAAQAPYDQHQQPYGGYGETYPAENHHDYAHNAQYGDDGRRGRDPENVSAPPPAASNEAPSTPRESREGDGLATPRPRSTSRVRFDLESNIAHSPDASRRKDDAKRDDPRDERRSSDIEDGKRRHRHRRSSRRDKGKERERDSRGGGGSSKRDSTGLMHDKYDRDRDQDQDSEGTIDLPDRFDEQGNRKAEDPLAEKINDLLSGKGGAGNIFKSLAEGFLGGDAQQGGSGGGGESDDGGGRRRRSRR